MKFDELFDQRNLVAMNLKNCIRDRGFTKISLAKKANISRPTLDKILNGSIDNKSTFDKHLQKIFLFSFYQPFHISLSISFFNSSVIYSHPAESFA